MHSVEAGTKSVTNIRKGIQHSTGSLTPGASGIFLSVSFGKFSGTTW